MTDRYTRADWEREDRALKEGGDPQPCPRCGRRGFYAPRFASPSRRYRACKFCGLWQNVGNLPHEIIRYEHHSVADWREPHEDWKCPECGTQFQPDQAVLWPIDNPDHPWHQAPREGTQGDFRRFWDQQGYLPRPFGIP